MSDQFVAKSRSLRSTIYSSRIEKQGVTSYTIYNHMLLPAGFEDSLEDTYNLACEKHEIEESKFQRGLIREFEKVSNNLLSRKRNSFLSLLKIFFFRSINRPTAKVQKGIYIWGSVGVGKTFMMDLFYDFLPIEGKQRYHFHEFMIMVHKILKKNM